MPGTLPRGPPPPSCLGSLSGDVSLLLKAVLIYTHTTILCLKYMHSVSELREVSMRCMSDVDIVYRVCSSVEIFQYLQERTQRR